MLRYKPGLVHAADYFPGGMKRLIGNIDTLQRWYSLDEYGMVHDQRWSALDRVGLALSHLCRVER